MQNVWIVVPLLVLGWSWTLQGIPVLPEPLFPTQENFDVTQLFGTWRDIAVAISCPTIACHHRDATIGKLVIKTGTSEEKLKLSKTVLRDGICKEISGEYELTDTPGRFFYHVEKSQTDVDTYVVHTNYDEYAIVIMVKQSPGQKRTVFKLYSRTMSVRDTIMDDFKTLVKQEGISEDAIVMKQNKGDCVPGQLTAEARTQPEAQRVRRNVPLPSLAPLDVEGSGDDTSLFNGTESCNAAPDTGPCFGLHQRYFYNSSSTSCEFFKYGGCLGNQNNFETEKECLQRCRTEAVCRLPMDAQPCTGHPIIWVFDSSAGLCVSYKAGFCQGNGNKFYSKAECEEYCGVIKEEEQLLKAN
ncbi:protein AMBP-like [Gouania willdenowi]|uniref:Protein AMBP n=1 Tax=Gouania willdenowi TaxID=441366 RepID=A0A8C5DUS6_GOUWI|nr:protein AMBP-like [Gouania willdenowi]